MRIETRRTRVIVMTQEEHRTFLETMKKAAEGHTSHYAEKQLADGSFLGVSIVPEGESNLQPQPRPSEYKPKYDTETPNGKAARQSYRTPATGAFE